MGRQRSYLVRVWTSRGGEGPQWAGRVERVQADGESRRFDDPEAMLACLRDELLESAAEVEQDSKGRS